VSAAARYVLDSSALIALVREETGFEKVLGVLEDAVIGAVNLAETLHKLVQKGGSLNQTVAILRSLELPVVPWSEELAYSSGEFAPLGWTHGLSLGDRACLTLAKHLGATAVTADREWRKIGRTAVPLLIFR
jgi:ribonuclease VapC